MQYPEHLDPCEDPYPRHYVPGGGQVGFSRLSVFGPSHGAVVQHRGPGPTPVRTHKDFGEAVHFSAVIGGSLPPAAASPGVRWYQTKQELHGPSRDFSIKYGVPNDLRLWYFRKLGPILWELRPGTNATIKTGDILYSIVGRRSNDGLNHLGAYQISDIDCLVTQGVAGSVTHPIGNVVRLRSGTIDYEIAEVMQSLKPFGAPSPIPTLYGRKLKAVRLKVERTTAEQALGVIWGPTPESTVTLRYNLVADSLGPEEARIAAHLNVLRNASVRAVGTPAMQHIPSPLTALEALRDAEARLRDRAILHGTK